MRTIRRHLLAATLLLLAAQGTGFVVPTGRCTCQSSSSASCCCCKSGKMESGMDCPMCKRAKHDNDATTCRCTARCGGHDAALPWLIEIDALLPGQLMPSALLALAPAPQAPAEALRDAVRKPPSPPPKGESLLIRDVL